jgi:hypothetical protein
METITDLETLISSMEPILDDVEYVFVTCKVRPEFLTPPILEFRESEGLALVVRRSEAERLGLKYEFPSKRITLMVYSSLSAVGFLAEICKALAQAGISVNPVSAFYHDNLFVPVDRAEDAMIILKNLASQSKK